MKPPEQAKDIIMRESSGTNIHQSNKPSFKDKLVGKQDKERIISLIEYEEFDFDDEVIMIDNEKIISSIRFSDKIYNEINAMVKQTIVVRLLSGGLGYRVLEVVIKAVWKPTGNYKIMDLKNNYYLIRFSHKSD